MKSRTNMRGRKALLIGLNYPLDPRNRLYGCVNDVKLMAAYLQERCDFDAENIILVTDEHSKNIPGTCYVPILERIYDLAISSWRENLDIVYFHYSGHGTQIADVSNDEKDGRDEGIVPTDFASRGPITDDVLKAVFAKFNPRTQIIAVFDCCHSGSILDLPFAYDNGASIDAGQIQEVEAQKCPRILMMSGCRDPETSADVFDEDLKLSMGAMTASLLKILKDNGKKRMSALKLQMALNESLKSRGYTQYALLSSNKQVYLRDVFL